MASKSPTWVGNRTVSTNKVPIYSSGQLSACPACSRYLFTAHHSTDTCNHACTAQVRSDAKLEATAPLKIMYISQTWYPPICEFWLYFHLEKLSFDSA